MADPIDDSDVNDALRIARQPSNLVYDSDVSPSYGDYMRQAGAGVHNYLFGLPGKIEQNMQRPQTISPASLVRSRFTPQGQAEASRSVAAAAQAAAQPFVSAVTAPSRAYRGEITPEQMFPEAMNFAGALTFGPMPTAGAAEANVLRMGMGPTAISDATQLAKRELSPLGYYSHAAEVAQGLQPSGSASQLISALKNTQGVKPEELMNAGLIDAQGNVHPDWAGRGKITREDLAGHLQSSMPQVQETVLGRIHEFPPKEIQEKYLQEYLTTKENFFKTSYSDPNYEKTAQEFKKAENNMKMNVPGWGIPESGETTKYGQYTLPGGENYREVVLHLPQSSEYVVRNKNDQILSKHPDRASALAEMQRQKENDPYVNIDKLSDIAGFQSSHFPQPDVLAHLRMADRTGPNGEKILHVEEIQSDWGQKGRDEGFDTPEARSKLLTSLPEGYTVRPSNFQRMGEEARHEVFDPNGVQVGTGYGRENAINSTLNDLNTQIRGTSASLVPSAPYVTNTGSWTDLALKRALKEAAEGGYDKLVWTPGAEQAGRYDLSKQLKSLDWVTNKNGVKDVAFTGSNGAEYSLFVNPNGKVSTNSPEIEHMINSKTTLQDVVGKDMAAKIMAENQNKLEGKGLSIGGEGMKEYYDKIVPNQLKKIAKHYDPNAKVGYTDVMLPPSGKAGTNNPPMAAPGLDITSQMREAIMRGQKAFQQGGRTLGNNAIDNAIRMATGGNAKSNFSQAFASARADYLAGNGPSTFNWKGKEYGVQVHGEKKLPPQAQPKRTTSTIGVDPTALHTMASDPVVRMGGTPATSGIEEFNLAGNADLNDIYNDDHPYVAKVKAEQPPEPMHDDVSSINGPSLLDSETPIIIPHSLKELQNWVKTHPHSKTMVKESDDLNPKPMVRASDDPTSILYNERKLDMPTSLEELQNWARVHHASGGNVHDDIVKAMHLARSHFGFGGDSDAAEGSHYSDNISHDAPSGEDRDRSFSKDYNSSLGRSDNGGSNFDGRMGRGQPETGGPIQHEVIGSQDFGRGLDFGGGNFTGHDMPTGLINYTEQRLNTPYEGTPMTAAMDPDTAFGMSYPDLLGVKNTRAGAAALLANLGYESTQNGKAFQPNAFSGSGYGLAQWTDPSRQKDFFNAMKVGTGFENIGEDGRPLSTTAKLGILQNTSAQKQLGYALNEIQNKYPQVAREMATAKSIPGSTERIMDKYESPANMDSLDSRIALANQIARGTGLGAFGKQALAPTENANAYAAISPSISNVAKGILGAGRGNVGVLDSRLGAATVSNATDGSGAIIDEGAVNSSNAPSAASTTQAEVKDTTPRIPVDSLEDPALIAAYNAQYDLSGPQNTRADMALGQRNPNVTTDNPFVNTIQGLSNFLTDRFTPNYNLGSEEYNKISQDPEPIRSNYEGRGGDRPQPYIPYIPPVETAAAAPIVPRTPYVPRAAYIPQPNAPYASLGANFIDPSVFQNPYLSQFLAAGGKVKGNNAMANAIRMAMGYKS